VEKTEDTRLILAGYGDELVDYIRLKCKTSEKILFKGKLSYEEVLAKSINSDLLFNLRDPIPLVNTYICGSKFLEALMCGVPILVNARTSVALKVHQEKCGLIVNAKEIDAIVFAINSLKKNERYAKLLGDNGRRSYERKYCWSIMCERLNKLYKTL